MSSRLVHLLMVSAVAFTSQASFAMGKKPPSPQPSPSPSAPASLPSCPVYIFHVVIPTPDVSHLPVLPIPVQGDLGAAFQGGVQLGNWTDAEISVLKDKGYAPQVIESGHTDQVARLKAGDLIMTKGGRTEVSSDPSQNSFTATATLRRVKSVDLSNAQTPIQTDTLNDAIATQGGASASYWESFVEAMGSIPDCSGLSL